MMSFKDKEKADAAKKRLDNGENFATIAKSESEDSKSAKKDGLIGEIPDGSSIPGFKESKRYSLVIFTLPLNKISEVEKIEDKYFIFMVEKYIPGKDRSFAEVIEQVKEDAFREKEFAEGMKLMERLSKTHDVMIFEDVVLGIPSN